MTSKKRPPHETREEKIRERDRIEEQRRKDKAGRKERRSAWERLKSYVGGR